MNQNPFDVVNGDTSKNSDKAIKQNKKRTAPKNVSNKTRPAKNKTVSQNLTKLSNSNKESSKKSKSKEANKSSNNKLIKDLTKQYSTDRLNMYDIIRLKLLQKVNGMKSRSQLIDDMIRIVKPVYLNSPTKEK